MASQPGSFDLQGFFKGLASGPPPPPPPHPGLYPGASRPEPGLPQPPHGGSASTLPPASGPLPGVPRHGYYGAMAGLPDPQELRAEPMRSETGGANRQAGAELLSILRGPPTAREAAIPPSAPPSSAMQVVGSLPGASLAFPAQEAGRNGPLDSGGERPDEQARQQHQQQQQLPSSSSPAPTRPSAPLLPLSGPSFLPALASKRKGTGRVLSGDYVVYDIDKRLPGEAQPQLEVSPVSMYTTEPDLRLGRRIAANCKYICYALRTGPIRVLNRETATRLLLRGHEQTLVDMALFAKDVHLLASAASDGSVFVRSISEGMEDGKSLILAVDLLELHLPAMKDCSMRVTWHPRQQEILVLAVQKYVLVCRISLLQEHGAVITCDIDSPPIGLSVLGQHEGDITDLSFSYDDCLVTSGVDGKVCLWASLKGGRAERLSMFAPHGGHPVNGVAFVSRPGHAGEGLLLTGGPLNREVRLWAASRSEAGSGSWQCVQTLELLSSRSSEPEEAFFNLLQVDHQSGLLLLPNVKRNAIYVIHLNFGARDDGAATARMDYLAEFSVTYPILSFFARRTSEDGDGSVTLYCMQPMFVQQYHLDVALCIPPEGTAVMDTAGTEGRPVLVVPDEEKNVITHDNVFPNPAEDVVEVLPELFGSASEPEVHSVVPPLPPTTIDTNRPIPTDRPLSPPSAPPPASTAPEARAVAASAPSRAGRGAGPLQPGMVQILQRPEGDRLLAPRTIREGVISPERKGKAEGRGPPPPPVAAATAGVGGAQPSELQLAATAATPPEPTPMSSLLSAVADSTGGEGTGPEDAGAAKEDVKVEVGAALPVDKAITKSSEREEVKEAEAPRPVAAEVRAGSGARPASADGRQRLGSPEAAHRPRSMERPGSAGRARGMDRPRSVERPGATERPGSTEGPRGTVSGGSTERGVAAEGQVQEPEAWRDDTGEVPQGAEAGVGRTGPVEEKSRVVGEAGGRRHGGDATVAAPALVGTVASAAVSATASGAVGRTVSGAASTTGSSSDGNKSAATTSGRQAEVRGGQVQEEKAGVPDRKLRPELGRGLSPGEGEAGDVSSRGREQKEAQLTACEREERQILLTPSELMSMVARARERSASPFRQGEGGSGGELVEAEGERAVAEGDQVKPRGVQVEAERVKPVGEAALGPGLGQEEEVAGGARQGINSVAENGAGKNEGRIPGRESVAVDGSMVVAGAARVTGGKVAGSKEARAGEGVGSGHGKFSPLVPVGLAPPISAKGPTAPARVARAPVPASAPAPSAAAPPVASGTVVQEASTEAKEPDGEVKGETSGEKDEGIGGETGPPAVAGSVLAGTSLAVTAATAASLLVVGKHKRNKNKSAVHGGASAPPGPPLAATPLAPGQSVVAVGTKEGAVAEAGAGEAAASVARTGSGVANAGQEGSGGEGMQQQLAAMQETLAQLVQQQKEMVRQMPAATSVPVIKEGKRIEAALSQRLEKVIKAHSEAQAARLDEDRAKRDKLERERVDKALGTLSTSFANTLGRDLPLVVEKVVKAQMIATGPNLVRLLAPAVKEAAVAALAEAQQKDKGAVKDTSQLEKAVVSKLEAALQRSVLAQFQTTFRQAMQESVRNSFQTLVLPSFEGACKAMFEQVDAAFQSGMAEHTAAAQAQLSAQGNSLVASLQEALASASSVTATLRTEITEGQRKLILLADSAGKQRALSLGVMPANGLSGADRALSLQHVEESLDPTIELSRLVSERKFEEAFNKALSLSDVAVVSWLCNQVEPATVCGPGPMALSQGVLLSLVQQLGCDLEKETLRKLAWIQEAALALNPMDRVLAPHMRPILEQLYQNLHRHMSMATSGEVSAQLRLVMHVVNSLRISCK